MLACVITTSAIPRATKREARLMGEAGTRIKGTIHWRSKLVRPWQAGGLGNSFFRPIFWWSGR